jgi:hypothetical protein
VDYADLFLRPWRQEYVTADAEASPDSLFLAQPRDASPLALGVAQSQATPPRSPGVPNTGESDGGGFWGGLLDVLRNVPITVGDPRHGQYQLGSYNQLTSGRRLMDYGRSMGLDLPQMGSVSPGEAELIVKHGMDKRQQQPLGMDFAMRLFPPQEGEDSSMGIWREGVSRMRQQDLGPLMAHVATQYGVPGFGGGGGDVLTGLLGAYPKAPAAPSAEREAAPVSAALPQPAGQPSAPPAGAAPSTAAMPPPAAAPAAPAVPTVPSPPPAAGAPPTAPSTAPLAQPQGAAGWQLPPMPREPTPPPRTVTQPDVEAYSPVQVAAKAYEDNRTLANRQNLRKTVQEAGPAILKQRDQEYLEQRKLHQDQMRTWIELKKERDATIKNWGLSQDMTDQILIDNPQMPPGSYPTEEQKRRAAYETLPARKAAQAGLETTATTSARVTSEAAAKQGLPLTQALSPQDPHPFRTEPGPLAGTPITTGTLGQAQQLQDQGKAMFLDAREAQRINNLREAAVSIARVNVAVQKVYDIANGQLGKMSPAERANPLDWLYKNWDQMTQAQPELIAAHREIMGNYMNIATGLMGGDKRVSEEELKLIKTQLPNVFARMDKIGSIGGRVGNWLTGGGYVNLPLGVPEQPDTREVAMSTMDSTMGRVNDVAASTLQKPGFQFPGLTPRGEAQQARERDEQARQAERAGATQKASPVSRLPLPGPIKAVGEAVHAVGEKVKEYVSPQAPPGPTGAAAPSLSKMKEIALRKMAIKQEPSPQDSKAFKEYMDTTHGLIKNYRRDLTPAQQADLVKLIAQKLGGTWQPAQ